MKVKEIILILFLGSILTSILTWPFITQIFSFYRDYGDFPLVSWILWYTQFSLKTGRIFDQTLYLNTTQFNPLPYTLVYTEYMLIPSLIFTPLYLITNNLILSSNLFIFIAFILSFLTSFITIKYFIKNTYASIIGATVYTFNPITFFQLPNHYNYMNKYFLPLVFLFTFRYFENPNVKNSFLFFLFFTLNALTLVYFQAFSLITILVILSVFLIFNLLNKNWKYFLNLSKYSLIFLMFLPILIYFNLPYLDFSKKEGVIRTVRENEYFSAKPLEWITTNRDNFIYGSFVKFLENKNKYLDWDFKHKEPVLFLNILPMLLSILGVYYLLNLYKKKKLSKSKLLLFISSYISLVTIFILMFGPLEIWFKLRFPFYYLYELTPVFKGIRVPSRFQFMFYVFFSLFVAYGVVFLFSKINKKHIIKVFFIILFILILENFNIRNYNEKSKIIEELNSNNLKNQLSFLKNKNTVHLPAYTPEIVDETRYLNWIILTEENMMNGNSGYYPSDLLIFLEKLNKKLDKEAFKELRLLDIDYVIIHKNLIDKNLGKNYDKNYKLYKTGKVFENNNLLIVNLNKYNLATNSCRREDFKNFLNLSILNKLKNNTGSMNLKNNNNCYIVNKFNNRYYLYQNPNGAKYVKLPLIIKPYERFKIVINRI